MHVITVRFEISRNHAARFREAVVQQARNSLGSEPGCHQFDVCEAPDDSGDATIFFLYEKYDDRAAFDAHLDSEHFRLFDAAVKDAVVSKSVDSWEGIYS